jgi:hypothetical protein
VNSAAEPTSAATAPIEAAPEAAPDIVEVPPTASIDAAHQIIARPPTLDLLPIVTIAAGLATLLVALCVLYLLA